MLNVRWSCEGPIDDGRLMEKVVALLVMVFFGVENVIVLVKEGTPLMSCEGTVGKMEVE